jgi:hypothetical protein
MPRIKKYYPASEIETGFYANPGEFVLQDGTEYVGVYCKVRSQLLTGIRPSRDSKFLYKSIIQHKSLPNQTYYKITKKEFDKHITPEYFLPSPTTQDYQNKSFVRYVVQRINDPTNITEISPAAAKAVNKTNKPGINGNLYRLIDIPWSLVGKDAPLYNDKTLQLKENVMPGIRAYFSDFSEFVK